MHNPKKTATCSHLGNIRFRRVSSDYIVTNDCGDWACLDQADFKRLLENSISKDEPLYQELKNKQFIDIDRNDRNKLAEQASKYLRLHNSAYRGPSLFLIILTLRCNQRCLYCQSTPETCDTHGYDMDESTAKKALDLIFQGPSQNVHIEFQGGEPLLNWPVLQYMVGYSQNMAEIHKKRLKLTVISNLILMDDEKLKFLLHHNVSIVTSLDGPAEVHDKNRPFLGSGKSHAIVVKQIKKINTAIRQKRKGSPSQFIDQLNAITTITKFSLPYAKEIIDEYVSLGFNNIFLRPLNPFGLERKTHKLISYKSEKFIAFYKRALDYILELNSKGTFILERNAFFALSKILKNDDPCFYDMRNPCGASIGQMAFNYDGAIYSCDEGRMSSRMGYGNFQIGHVNTSRVADLIDNEVTKTLCISSCLDNQASCSDCAYKPYCGVCPLVNFVEYGNLFPQIPATDSCKIKMAIFDHLFKKLKNKKIRAVFEDWFRRMAAHLYERSE